MDRIIVNANVFVDGVGYFGKCTTLTPPKPKVSTEKYRGGGMEAMECSASFRGIDKRWLDKFGIAAGSGRSVPMTFRGALRSRDGSDEAVVINVRGPVTEIDWGDWKAGEEVEVKLMMEPTFYKCQVAGETTHEIDLENAIRIINGVDQLASLRQALGLS